MANVPCWWSIIEFWPTGRSNFSTFPPRYYIRTRRVVYSSRNFGCFRFTPGALNFLNLSFFNTQSEAPWARVFPNFAETIKYEANGRKDESDLTAISLRRRTVWTPVIPRCRTVWRRRLWWRRRVVRWQQRRIVERHYTSAYRTPGGINFQSAHPVNFDNPTVENWNLDRRSIGVLRLSRVRHPTWPPGVFSDFTVRIINSRPSNLIDRNV